MQQVANPPTAARPPIRRFLVREGDRLIVLSAAQIDWVEAEGNYVLVHAAGKRYMLREKLGVMADLLRPYGVFRANRSVLVNVEFIQELRPMFKGGYTILLKDGARVSLTTGLRSLESVAKLPTPAASPSR